MQNLETSFKTKLSDSDFSLFKKWVKNHLNSGPVTVLFTKKDGTEREMLCTTCKDFTPPVEVSEKPKKATNEEVQPVFDLNAKAWRSFRWDSIKKISISIGEQ